MRERTRTTKGGTLSAGARAKPELFQEGAGDVSEEADSGVWCLLAFLLVFRMCNAVLSYSAFVPDEYWQSLEVAHRMVFGYPNRSGWG